MHLILLLLGSAFVVPQEDASQKARDLVRKLHSDNILEREDAAGKLGTLGEAALPALEKAVEGSDPEVAATAKKILGTIGANLFEKIGP